MTTEKAAAMPAWMHWIWTRLADDRERTLHGYHAILGRYIRFAFAIAALSNVVGALSSETPPGFRVLRLVVACAAVWAFWWTRDRIPSMEFRVVSAIGFTLWTTGMAIATSRNGWPTNLELIPVGATVIALAVSWPMALVYAATVIMSVVVGWATDVTPIPPHAPLYVGNLLITCGTVLYITRRLLSIFETGATDLIESSRQLDAARNEAILMARDLAQHVSRAVEALRDRLSDGPAAARDATAEVQHVLASFGVRASADRVMRQDDFRDRMVAVRQQLARVLVPLGVVLFVVQVIRLWWIGAHTVAWVVGGQFLLLVGIWIVFRRWPDRWKGCLRAAAGITVASYLVNMPAWDRLLGPVTVHPGVPFTLTLLMTFGLLGGDRLIVVAGPAIMILALLLRMYHAVWNDVLVCLSYAVLGIMLTVLPTVLLVTIQERRRAALQALMHRRRLVGTLLHDLANPLQAVHDLLSTDTGSDASRVPPDVPQLVQRMRVCVNEALGQHQPAESISVADIVQGALLTFGARIASRRITVLPVLAPDLTVHGTRSLVVDTIMASVLSQAVAFSSIGSTIRIEATAQGRQVTMDVHQEAAGLPADVLHTIEIDGDVSMAEGSLQSQQIALGLANARGYLGETGGSLSFLQRAEGGLITRLVLPRYPATT